MADITSPYTAHSAAATVTGLCMAHVRLSGLNSAAGTLSYRATVGASSWRAGGGWRNVAKAVGETTAQQTLQFYAVSGETVTIEVESDNASDTNVTASCTAPVLQKIDLDTIKTQPVTCDAPVTFRRVVGRFPASEENNADAGGLAIARNSDRVVWCPYDTVDTGSPNWGRVTAGTSYFITVGKKYQFRQSGMIESAQFRVGGITNTTAVHLTIWRKFGGKYCCVGKTADILDQLTASTTCTVYFKPIAVEEGDYYGYEITTTGSGYQLVARTGQTGVTTYKSDATAGYEYEDPSAWADTYAGVVVPILFYGRAPQILCIGDSLAGGGNQHGSYCQTMRTTENPDAAYIAKVGQKLHCAYQNMGVGSENSTATAARFTADAVSLCPRIAIVTVGINDHNAGITQAVYLSNMTTMLDACQANGIIPVICLIAPSTALSDARMTERDAWSAALIALAATYPTAVVVDLDPYLGKYRATGPAGNLWDIQTAFDDDGVHFTAIGYSRYADAVLDALTQVGYMFLAQAAWERPNGIETGVTPKQVLQRIGAVVAGKVSGAGSGVECFTGLDGATPRVAVTTSPAGNRLSVTYDPT